MLQSNDGTERWTPDPEGAGSNPTTDESPEAFLVCEAVQMLEAFLERN